MKLLNEKEFISKVEEYGEISPNDLTDWVFNIKEYTCACGKIHKMDTYKNIIVRGPYMKFLVQCPYDKSYFTYLNAKLSLFMKIKGYETLAIHKSNVPIIVKATLETTAEFLESKYK